MLDANPGQKATLRNDIYGAHMTRGIPAHDGSTRDRRQLGRILATLPRPEGEQIFVTGHVGVPGSYLLRGQDRTLLHALTAAQGVTSETASAGAPIIIVRFKDSRNGELIKIDLNRLVSGADLDIPLQPGDVVVVP